MPPYDWSVAVALLLGGVVGFALRAILVTQQRAVMDAYERGKSGALSDWSVTIEPYRKEKNGWLTNSVEVGYAMQLAHQGMPVLDPTIRVVEVVEGVDKERADELMNKALALAGEVAKALVAHKFNARLKGR